MTLHRDTLATARERVIEAAKLHAEGMRDAAADLTAVQESGRWNTKDRDAAWSVGREARLALHDKLLVAVDDLLALEAQTCGACGGSGHGNPERGTSADVGLAYFLPPCPSCSGTGRRAP